MTVPRTNASHDQNFQPTMMGVSTADGTTPVPIEVDPTTGGLISGGKLVTASFDYVGYTNTSTTVDTYVYKTGGSGGTTVATVTITYTDTTKAQISTAVKT